MPGSRLTQREREQIAAGLAVHADYAEIARGIGRPTSTVSREVRRNGGPAAYRSDRAHRATRHRASRRPAIGSLSEPPDSPPVREFVDRFAALMVETGVPRMAARVLTRLYVTDSGSLTAAELVRLLRVSPASVSKAIGYLEDLDLIRRERAPGARRDRYVVDDDVWSRSWRTSARQHAAWAEAAGQGADLLGRSSAAGARLQAVQVFFTALADDMSLGISAEVATDALTVVAALVLAGRPLGEEALAGALGWPSPRMAACMHALAAYSDLAGALTVERTPAGAYVAAPRTTLLTPAQRAALTV